MVSEPLCSKEVHSAPPDHRQRTTCQETSRCKRDCGTATFIWLIFSFNSKPQPTIFSPLNSKLFNYTFSFLIKKAGLKWNVRWSFRIHNPVSTHLQLSNKARTENQYLSLLIGSGGDKQDKCQLLCSHTSVFKPGKESLEAKPMGVRLLPKQVHKVAFTSSF